MTQDTRNGKSNKDYTKLTFTTPMLTKQEAYNRGVEAANAMGHPVMNLAVQSCRQSLLEEMAMTKPEEVKKREWLMHQVHGLSAVFAELHGWYQAAAKIEKEAMDTENYTQQQNAAMTQADQLYS